MLKRLGNHFSKLNQRDDANKAYYYQKLAELEEATCGNLIWNYFLYLVFGLTSNYNTSLLKIMVIIIVINIMFTLIFFYYRLNLNKEENHESNSSFEFKFRPLELPGTYIENNTDLSKSKTKITIIDAWRFSTVILLKIGYRDIKVKNNKLTKVVKIQWWLGAYLLIVFLITLINTLPIVSELLSGVF